MALRNHVGLAALGLMLGLGASVGYARTTICVDSSVVDPGNGTCWSTPYKFLQDALDEAYDNWDIDEIHVAGGTYRPDQDQDGDHTPDERTETFRLFSGLGLYGGYAGLADSDNPDDRNIEAYRTILSGDLSEDDGDGEGPFDNIGDNSYHVVTTSETGETAVLDGFTIVGGNAGLGVGGGVYNDGGSPMLRYCTITRNLGRLGGGMYNGGDGSPRLEHCTFSANKAYFGETGSGVGGGMYNDTGTSPILSNCTFSGNEANGVGSGGGGMTNKESSPKLANCVFSGNTAPDYGGAMLSTGSTLTLVNCTFAGNKAGQTGGAIALTNNCNLSLVNSTFAANSAPSGRAVACGYPGSPGESNVTLANCILWDDGNEVSNADGSAIVITWSDVFGGWPGEGNRSADPGFAWELTSAWSEQATYDVNTSQTTFTDRPPEWDEGQLVGRFLKPHGAQDLQFVIVANTAYTVTIWGKHTPLGGDWTYVIHDYHLRRLIVEPPCIDAGDNAALPDDFADLDGDGVTDEPVPLDGDLRPRRCDDPGPNPGNGTPPIVDMGAYEYVTVTPQATLYVNGGATAGCDPGTSWDAAYTDLQDALDVAAAFPDVVREIWVAAGTYKPARSDPAATFQLLNNLGVYGGFTGGETDRDDRDWENNETILSGDLKGDDGPDFENNDENSYHIVVTGTGTDETAVLDGFTITGGNADGDGHDGTGGGMYNEIGASPTVANCSFSANSARTLGGGMYNSGGSPNVANCTFSGNLASVGGGMYNGGGSPDVANCTFSGNLAGSGGGMSNVGESDPILVDCTFSANVAGYDTVEVSGGGGIYNDVLSAPTLVNCTLTGNTAINNARGGGIYNTEGSGGTLTNCIFSGNTSENNGGGMYNLKNSGGTLTDCTFSANSADGEGGGMFNEDSDPTLTNCIFSGNSAQVSGGGMDNYSNSAPRLTDCEFSGNMAPRGGGMNNLAWAGPTLVNCLFSENTAYGVGYGGGGMHNFDSSDVTLVNCTFIGNLAAGGAQGGGMFSGDNSNANLTNCVFSGNLAWFSGGGMYSLTNSGATLTNCSFSANLAPVGGGMFNEASSNATLANCILWGNLEGQLVDDEFSHSTVTYSNIEGGWPGQCNIDDDPLFADAALRLSPGSPCMDAAYNDAVPADITTDRDDNPRFVDDPGSPDCPQCPDLCGDPPIVDMGAYELQFAPVIIPTSSEWGMVAMTLLLLTVGTLVLTRPRRVRP